MEELFWKLDLKNYLENFKGCLSREKPIFIQGDTKQHFIIINELALCEYTFPPSVQNQDIQLAHLSKQGILGSKEIYEFIKIISYMKYLKNQNFQGALGAWIDKIEIPKEIDEILFWFDEKGELKEDIDERFISINFNLKEVRAQINSKAREIIFIKRLETYLVDRQIHYINSQEALLLRGGFNHALKGTVIGRSSGGYFYVVPEVLDNLKKKESILLDQKEEIIYEYAKKISLIFAKFLFFLKFINKTFDRFDAYNARVVLAKRFNMEFVLPSKNKDIVLYEFSHPALSNPKSINIEFMGKVLMITGVNAGGKTMLLKSILSAVLLAKYLLPMPINASKSKIGSFKTIEAIIEDPQNVKNDISTFAGRMVHFSGLFGKNDILVGVDEIELGTDADEAASLYKVIIEQLMKQDIKIIITTHHKRLASLLAVNEDVDLLAALYDEKSQRPIFSFLKGTIGKSYAFETAQRYGIPITTIEKAKEIYGEDKENLNDLIQKNIDLELSMKQKLRSMEENRIKTEKLKEKLLIQMTENEKDYKENLNKLEFAYEKAISEAKKAAKANTAKESHQNLNLAHKIKQKIPQIETKQEIKKFKIGDGVKYNNIKGNILYINNEKAVIQSEGIKMHVELKDLKKIGNFIKHNKKSTIKIIKSASPNSIRLDLHGLRAQEAIEELDKFISDALVNGFDEVIVCHGIGTGKLAFAVKEFLKKHPKILGFSDAPPSIGGVGATVVRI